VNTKDAKEIRGYYTIDWDGVYAGGCSDSVQQVFAFARRFGDRGAMRETVRAAGDR